MTRKPHLALLLGVWLFGGPVGAETPTSPLSPDRTAKLQRWFEAAGEPRPGEPFGAYLSRVASFQHGVAYGDGPPPAATETLHVALDRFECVSFIESSLAVARCGWKGETSPRCFEGELTALRYRDGEITGYSSRLHYFVDWIYDNEGRGRLRNLTPELGGEPVTRKFFYITGGALARAGVPSEELGKLSGEMQTIESRLSGMPHRVLSRDRARHALRDLADGDLVAFTRERPGLLVHHAGFVYRVGDSPRLLHASSYHQRVVLTPDDVTSYLLRRPERRGVIVARPLAPQGSPPR